MAEGCCSPDRKHFGPGQAEWVWLCNVTDTAGSSQSSPKGGSWLYKGQWTRGGARRTGLPLPAKSEPVDWNDITLDPLPAVGHTLAYDYPFSRLTVARP